MVEMHHYAISLAAGIASHVFYFNRGEHHLYGPRYIQAFFALSILSVVYLHKGQGQAIIDATANYVALSGTFLTGLYSSLFIYRAFLSPLRKFPGPFGARITNFWLSKHIGNSSHALYKIQDLHKKYGPIVRIGSNDLSIADAQFVQPIYGPGSTCSKSVWYDREFPRTSLHTERSRAAHDKRRRVWSPAFSDKALRGYEKRIEPYADMLLERIRSFGEKPVEVGKWFNFFGYDVMGNLAFGKDFGMLSRGEGHFAIDLLNEGMSISARLYPTWVFRTLAAIPGAETNYWKFLNYCSQQLDDRMKTKPDIPDLSTPLLAPYEGKKPTGQPLAELRSDTRLLIVAGSDTSSAATVYMFYHLAQEPSIQSKAREELLTLLNEDGSFNHRAAMHNEYINGLITETLRLHPAVPSGLERCTPPEGLQVGETFIPGNTHLFVPQYTVGRSETAYVDPEKFIPERWSTRPDLVKNKDAYMAFGAGPWACIGRPLAMMELRCVLAKLLIAFDVSLAPGEDGAGFIERCRDHFTIETGPLHLVFKARSSLRF